MSEAVSRQPERRVPPLPKNHGDGHGDGDGALRAMLDQKEKDLVLAAELGKALLEKNEELRRQNEQLEREFAENVEVRMKERKIVKASLHQTG